MMSFTNGGVAGGTRMNRISRGTMDSNFFGSWRVRCGLPSARGWTVGTSFTASVVGYVRFDLLLRFRSGSVLGVSC